MNRHRPRSDEKLTKHPPKINEEASNREPKINPKPTPNRSKAIKHPLKSIHGWDLGGTLVLEWARDWAGPRESLSLGPFRAPRGESKSTKTRPVRDPTHNIFFFSSLIAFGARWGQILVGFWGPKRTEICRRSVSRTIMAQKRAASISSTKNSAFQYLLVPPEVQN